MEDATGRRYKPLLATVLRIRRENLSPPSLSRKLIDLKQFGSKPECKGIVMRTCLILVVVSTLTASLGCTPMVPANQLQLSQRTTQQWYASAQEATNQSMAAQQQAQTAAAEAQAMAAQAQALAAQAQSLAAEKQQLESNLIVANQRIQNLTAERQDLQTRFVSAVEEAKQNALSDSLTQRFQNLAAQYPDFQFDATTGISRFNENILFNSGSDGLRTSALPILQQFAQILTAADAQQLRVLVCGHTDDQRIAQRGTFDKHPTNWHLSTNRANAVVLALRKYGIGEDRMGAMGYSKTQPIAANSDDQSRQRNRRVEIYVLAPEASIAQWDPVNYR